MRSAAGEEAGRGFALAEATGRYREPLTPDDLPEAVSRASDPGAARRTLHWGRNYLYVVDLPSGAGVVPAVVKQFRNEGWRARLRRRWRESRAATSWRVACRLADAGVATPAPLLLIESKRPAGPSFFVSRELDSFVESRYLFRALERGDAGRRFPRLDPAKVFAAMGRLVRRMHDAGVWHRDLSIGNLLVVPGATREEEPEIWVIDLNRARLDRRLGELARLQDLCRLPIRTAAHREAFLGAYWGDGANRVRDALFVLASRGFLLKNRLKRALRAPFRWLGRLKPRRAYPHIPPPPAGAGRREKAVWDHLSDQPHQHAGSLEKTGARLADAGLHLRTYGGSLAPAARALRRYRKLRRELYRRPRPFRGLGVCLRPWPDDPAAPLAAVDELGIRRVFLRLHPWEEDHRAEAELAAELAARETDITFGLAQSRELVRDPERWRSAVARLGEAFLPHGRRFQIGQAVNRSKWGIWNAREYHELADVAEEVLRGLGEVELLGPAVIDFELHATVALVNQRRRGRFDGLASLLYVDRRGAPENPQLGFDAIGKVVLLKAIAETARDCGPESWITEFNWPLEEGPHAPAGRAVAVSEELQADYLARFYLMALGTGLLEGAFWWQAIARGYGLIDPEGLRRRPAFRALATLAAVLEEARFEGPLATPPPAWLYRFTAAEGEIVAGWSSGGTVVVELPRPARAVVGRDGAESPGAGPRVEVGSSPAYFLLADP
ncbi:MAG: lipopolysaccharide kinase InaA family protein [Thermoanaerobaculia bacterium]|nr:lipopolysaccharide kinase InaA family protein [Thermoanaerobaculia bacterium]